MNKKRIIFIILAIVAAIAAWYLYQEFVKWQALREKATKVLDIGEGVVDIVKKPIEAVGEGIGGLLDKK